MFVRKMFMSNANLHLNCYIPNWAIDSIGKWNNAGITRIKNNVTNFQGAIAANIQKSILAIHKL